MNYTHTKKGNGNQEDDVEKSGKSNCGNIGEVNCVSIGTNRVLRMCVAPARIFHDESDKELIVFAIPDTCSQGTFGTEDLMKQLNIIGTKTSINIKNLTGNERQSSHVKM